MKLEKISLTAIPLVFGLITLSPGALGDFSVSISANYNHPYTEYHNGSVSQQRKAKVLNPSHYRANSANSTVYNSNRPTIIIIQPGYQSYPFVQPTGNYCYRSSDFRVRAPGWNNACSIR